MPIIENGKVIQGLTFTMKYEDQPAITSSFQAVAADLSTNGAGLGAEGKKVAAIMGNLIDGSAPVNVTTKPMMAGVIGAFSFTKTVDDGYPSGAVLAQISDGVDDIGVHGVVSYIDGDSATTRGGAAYKVKSNNSIAASGFERGLDLQDAAHDGYLAVNEAFYKKSLIRLPIDVVVLVKNGAPTNGTSGDGAGEAGPGSLLVDRSGAKLYINTNTKASPTWTVVGSQS